MGREGFRFGSSSSPIRGAAPGCGDIREVAVVHDGSANRLLVAARDRGSDVQGGRNGYELLAEQSLKIELAQRHGGKWPKVPSEQEADHGRFSLR